MLYEILLKHPLDLQLFAGEGEGDGSSKTEGGESGSGGSGEGKGSGEGSGGGEGKSDGEKGEKTFTQAELDAAIRARLDREKKKTDALIKKLQQQLDELSGKAPAGGESGDGGNAGGEDPAAKAAAILAQANQRVINAVAQTEAVKLGVDPKYVADVVKLADLSKVEVDENGNVDASLVSKALDEVLKRVPVFKANAGGEGNGGGFKVGGDGQGSNKSSGNGWNSNRSTQDQPKRWNRWNSI